MPAVAPDASKPLEPGLYVVSTPIGNLRDMTLRAIDVLAAADFVLAEDTRTAARLLKAYGLSNKVERYDDHSGERARPAILERLLAGGRVALTTDAGTPLVSDPGYRLVREAAEAGVAVRPIPGASALLAGLAVAGLPTDRFLFAGFAPPRSAGRRAMFEGLASVRATLVFYESGPRLAASLADMAAVFGDRPAVVARELTKLHEATYRAGLATLAVDPALDGPRGELVVLVGPGAQAQASADEIETALREALRDAGPAEAASQVAHALGLARRDLYRRALALRTAAEGS